ncbi:hypothetical protein LCGC14_0900950 [marine sediment metagenome]|uniref:Uncharacterized protein n=1 Tax=marine sediment metagenome TaxID=412755 RepID=A0A0F9P1F1_9ZZZZ
MSKQYTRGSAKEHVFDNGSSLVNFSLNIENLKEKANEDGWIQLVMTARQEVDQYGNTHLVYFNDFKPKPQGDAQEKEPEEDLPF